MKEMFKALKLKQFPYIFFRRKEFNQNGDKILKSAEVKLGYPVIVKPANLGSSIGISVCHNFEELSSGIETALDEYYDLSLINRDKTDDKVTFDSANAVLKYGVAVKCATITPNAERVKEYNLKKMYPSPNGTIRAIMDGTVFRAPILVKGITPFIPSWVKPIIIARHAYGDIYKNVESRVESGSIAELVITDKNGKVTKQQIHNFTSDGVVMGMHNTDKSIEKL
ncbi:nadp-specific isocitrate dehydrogenase [Holotrichia oblita]|nr:nadp-specific isocitrate dehydrogenase [Holotrichia oblita]